MSEYYSRMADTTLCNVPFTSDFPVSLSGSFEDDIKSEKEKLEGMGVKIVGIHIQDPDGPARFFIEFPPSKPSFTVRTELEKEGYDVGQQMGDKMLKFYATKRLVKKGWD